MRVIVLGSTGFLGRSIVAHLAAAGHEVAGVSRSGRPSPEAPHTSAVALDLTSATPRELDDLLDGADAVVHGLGPDDRERVPAPALAYFRRMQVAPTVAVAAAARRARVGTMVILGSYFSHFDRVRPGLDLAAAHPYIQARREQTAQARAAGPEVVTNLEIPFVFGAVPGVVPMWKSYLVDPLRRMPVGFVPRGTSAAVTDGDVAQAVSLALDGRIIGSMPIATDNYSFDRLARVMLGALGHPRRPVVGVPNGVLALGMRTEAARLRLKKMDSGLDLARLPHDLIGADLSLDTTDFGEAIGLSPRTIDDAVIATVRASQ